MDFKRGTFRVRGDVLEIIPAYRVGDMHIRVEFFGDEIDRITEIDVLTGEIKDELEHVAIFPASHYVVPQEKINQCSVKISKKNWTSGCSILRARTSCWRHSGSQSGRILISRCCKETGFCSGIENYSRHLAGLEPGQPPHTLMDYFPDDFLIIIDESHKTMPQIGGMYHGDQSRKSTLVDYGFRLPSAQG